MSVDVSNKRYTFNATLGDTGYYIAAPFYAGVANADTDAYYSMSYSSGDLRFNYGALGANNITVYTGGAWVDDSYRTIVFDEDVTLSDSQYAWFATMATEQDAYTTAAESLVQVANAIRDRSDDGVMLTYPDGFDTAIRNIGNYAEGASIAYNQLCDNVSSGSFASVTVTNDGTGYLTFSGTSDSSGTFNLLPQSDGVYWVADHVYYVALGTLGCSGGTSQLIARNVTLSANYMNVALHQTHPASRLITAENDGLMRYYINCSGSGRIFSGGLYPMVIDVTVLLGKTVADALQTIDSDTVGAGAAILEQLLKDDYYPMQRTPTMSSIEYKYDFSVQGSKTLRGIVSLDSDNNIHKNCDIMTPKHIKRTYKEVDLGDLTWTYSNTGLIFTAELSDGRPKYYNEYNQTLITDAYPWYGVGRQMYVDWSTMPDGYCYQYAPETSADPPFSQIKIKELSETDPDAFKTLVTGKKLVYELYTTTIET